MSERRTQAERRAQSRQRLIVAAIKLLAERGYARTSLVEIGREAGLSRGLVSHHFGSKEACMRAVVQHIQELAAEQAQQAASAGSDMLDQLIDTYFDGVRGGLASRAMYVIIIEGLTSTPGLRPAVAKTNAISRSHIRNCLAELLYPSPDPLSPPPDVESLAVLTLGILRGVALQWLADPGAVDLEAAKEAAKALIYDAVLGRQPVH